jgi:hypothetical protein
MELYYQPQATRIEAIVPGRILSPVCIEFGHLVYWAIVTRDATAIRNGEGSIQCVGGHPRVMEDGVLDRADLRLAELNARVSELGRKEGRSDRWLITTTIAETDQRDVA